MKRRKKTVEIFYYGKMRMSKWPYILDEKKKIKIQMKNPKKFQAFSMNDIWEIERKIPVTLIRFNVLNAITNSYKLWLIQDVSAHKHIHAKSASF